MITKSKLAASLTLVSAMATLNLAPAAHAADFAKILQSFTGVINGWSDMDARQAQIETRIAAAIVANQLTATEASGFRAELAQIEQSEAQIKATGRSLSFTQSLSFTNDLNNLSTRIEQTVSARAASAPDVDTLQAQLGAQIDSALTDGSLSQTEATSLRLDLKRVADIEAAFKAGGDGTLTSKQTQILVSELDKIKIVIEQQARVTQSAIPELNNRRTAISKKISEALLAGKLSQAEADDFNREVERIAAMQSSFTAAAGTLNGNRVLTLAGELDRLNTQVDLEIQSSRPLASETSTQTSLDTRILELRNKIQASHTSGQLKQHEEDRFLTELDDIQDRFDSFKNRRGFISQENRVIISGDLDRFDSRVDRVLRSKQRGIAGIDARRTQLLTRINTSRTSGKLSRRDSETLMREYNRIGKLLVAFKATNGNNLSISQMARLNADLNRLDRMITQEISVRGSASFNHR